MPRETPSRRCLRLAQLFPRRRTPVAVAAPQVPAAVARLRRHRPALRLSTLCLASPDSWLWWEQCLRYSSQRKSISTCPLPVRRVFLRDNVQRRVMLLEKKLTEFSRIWFLRVSETTSARSQESCIAIRTEEEPRWHTRREKVDLCLDRCSESV